MRKLDNSQANNDKMTGMKKKRRSLWNGTERSTNIKSTPSEKKCIAKSNNLYHMSGPEPQAAVDVKHKAILKAIVNGHKMPWDAIDALAQALGFSLPIRPRVTEEPIVMPVVLSCCQWFENT